MLRARAAMLAPAIPCAAIMTGGWCIIVISGEGSTAP
jgi:hypothetical protein